MLRFCLSTIVAIRMIRRIKKRKTVQLTNKDELACLHREQFVQAQYWTEYSAQWLIFIQYAHVWGV